MAKEKTLKTLSEFKSFILRGNVVDLAVGVIVGGAFNRIVTSLVGDILTPFLSVFTASARFEELKIPLSFLGANPEGEIPTIHIGSFISATLDFLIMAFVVFLLVKLINRIRRTADELQKKQEEEKAAEPPAAETKACPYCISDIPVQATRCPCCTSELS